VLSWIFFTCALFNAGSYVRRSSLYQRDMKSTQSHIAFAVLISIFHIFVPIGESISVTLSCFYPDGTPTNNDRFLCDSTGKYGHCCKNGDECTENGLCINPNGSYIYPRYWREACVDRHWGSTCPQFCDGPATGMLNLERNRDFPVMAHLLM
jgi:hypothetical protein